MKIYFKNTTSVYEYLEKLAFTVGGFDSSTKSFNTDTNYYHSNFVATKGCPSIYSFYTRFVVFSNDGSTIVDYVENPTCLTGKFAEYAYCAFVTNSDTYNNDNYTKSYYANPSKLFFTPCAGIDSSTGSVISSPSTSLSNVISNAAKMKLYKDGVETTDLGSGYMAYYDASKTLLGVVRNTIDATKLAASTYVQFSIYADTSSYTIGFSE